MTLPPLAILLLGCTGLVLGSFSVTAGLRLSRGKGVLAGRSRCDHCQAQLSFAQTVPLASYALAFGRCRRCGGAIDPIHLAGEVVGALVVSAAVLTAQAPIQALLLAAAGLALLTSAVVDARTQRLPDMLTGIIAISGAGLSALRGDLVAGLVSAVIAFLLIEGVRRGFAAVKGRPGLGFGDVKLVAALALWLGLATPLALAGAAAIGLIAFAILRPAGGRLPFGPALAAAGFAIGILGDLGLLAAWQGLS
jgi:leader peptidase (prepilin peptidase)/N-methyltransferase